MEVPETDYPCPEHIKEALKKGWKPITLCSIAGWVECLLPTGESFPYPPSEIISMPFGGYIKVENKTGKFRGKAIDLWGASEIEGIIKDKGAGLEFTKIYFCDFGLDASKKPIKVILHYDPDKKAFLGNWDYDPPLRIKIGASRHYQLYDKRIFVKTESCVENAYGFWDMTIFSDNNEEEK